ncbi:MAG: DUF6527 family protein [Bacteroidaceae bacterium]|jgi:hypothetical protein
MKIIELTPQFVNELPYKPKEGVLYISMLHTITLHLCPCGCGNMVYTPISPNSWKMVYDGKVSLTPSIGNFEIPCHSHYFIVSNCVVWCHDDRLYHHKSCPQKRSKSQWRLFRHWPKKKK